MKDDASEPGNPLIAKLENITTLSADDRQALIDICRDVRIIAPHTDIIREGDRPDFVHLMIEGWAARYKVVDDGGRQITAFLIPGDFCDLHVSVLREMDHSILTLTSAKVVFIPRDRIDALTLDRPELLRALWWATLVDEAVLRAWIVNIGRRSAYAGVAHLICEMHRRMDNIGLVEGDKFDLPLTQEELSDALGLTPVHTNRVLQRLRAEGLITFKNRRLTILDPAALDRAAGFDANYLHSRKQVRP